MSEPAQTEIAALATRLAIGVAPDELDALHRHVTNRVSRALAFGPLPDDGEGKDHRRADRPFAWSDDLHRAFITTCSIASNPTDGPLAGRTVALKDHIAVAGLPMTLASAMFRNHIADQDATLVTRLLAAGATIVGKNNLSAFSGTELSAFGKPRNPHAPDREPGGSSSGSAVAVAAGLADVAIGGDQGGSIRIPSAWCGVVGLKPTFGLVPHTGVVSGLEPSIDHVGPIARTVRDAAVVLGCIAGPDGQDQRQIGMAPFGDPAGLLGRGVHGLRIGVLREGFSANTTPDVERAVRAAIDHLAREGAQVSPVSVACHEEVQAAYFCCLLEGTFHLARTNLSGDVGRGGRPESVVDAVARLGWGAAPLEYRANVLAGAYLFERFGGRLAVRAQNARPGYVAQYERALHGLDALVMPTVPILPPRIDDPPASGDPLLRVLNTLPFDYTGHPALTVPCGAVDGLPVGLQLVGTAGAEATLFRIAEVVEHAFPPARPPAPS
jgi:amidase